MAKNIQYRSGDGGITLRLPVPGTVVSGDLVELGDLHGLAITSYRADDGRADVLLPSVMIVKGEIVNAVNAGGNSAVAIGDKLYYTAADPIKVSKKATGKACAFALGTLVAGANGEIPIALLQA